MLNSNSTRVATAALAILFVTTQSNNALGAFAFGDVITYPQDSWGAAPAGSNAAALLNNNYFAVYTSTFGVVEVGVQGTAGFSIRFTNSNDLLNYLPSFGMDGPLNTDYVNPSTTESGGFAGEVMALRLNIDSSDAGLTLGNLGIPFGDHQLQNFILSQINLNGLSARQFSAEVNNLLGGGSSLFYSIPQLNPVTEELNRSFSGGSITTWAQDHLRVAAGIPGDYNANGIVDAADYVVWRKGLGTTYTQNQYNVWRANFGKTPGSGAALAALPEPATASLTLISLLGLAWHRIRRNSC